MQIQPEEYDLVVVGTGLQESLVAAAASLAGKSVLHLDPQPEYGSHWAGLTLDRFLEAFPAGPALDTAPAREAANGIPPGELLVCDGAVQVHSDIEVQRRADAELSSLRQYTIDLAPKLLYTVGPVAEALLRCKAESYCTFRLVPSFIWQAGRAVPVPASRADIFKSRSLTPAEKRLLMRFLKASLEALDGEGPLAEAFDERPFTRLLAQEGLPQPLQETLLYSLALLDTAQSASAGQPAVEEGADVQRPAAGGPETAGQAGASEAGAPATAAAALERLKLYVGSVSRHGGALMVPDYGAGELPQAFCRTAAVHGTLYVLRCGAAALLTDQGSGRCAGVRTSTGQVIRCKALAAAVHHLPECFVRTKAAAAEGVARAVALLEAPGIEPPGAEGEARPGQLLLTLPPGSLGPGVPRNPVRALQLGSHSSVAPAGRCVLHLSTVGLGGVSDLTAALTALAGGSQPLLAVFYRQQTRLQLAAELPPNVAACQPPDESVGYGSAVAGAEAAFARLFPGEPFLPPLPQPDAGSDSD